MDSIEKYNDSDVVGGVPIYRQDGGFGDDSAAPNFLQSVRRRWWIILITSVVICCIGIPAVWLIKKPTYMVQGAIRVAPIQTDILSGESDEGGIGSLDSFMNTQARIITSNQIVQRAADELVGKNLKFFAPPDSKNIFARLIRNLGSADSADDMAGVLKKATSDGTITAEPAKKTELIIVSMESRDAREAEQIVDAFIRAYLTSEVASSMQDEGRKLALLESEQNVQVQKLRDQRNQIKVLAEEFGSKSLDKRQEMKLDRVAMLLNEATKYEALAVQQEAKVSVLKDRIEKQQNIGPVAEGSNTDGGGVDKEDPSRQVYIASAPEVVDLVRRISNLEEELLMLQQRLAAGNPELQFQAQIIEDMGKKLVEKKELAGQRYDQLKAKENIENEMQGLERDRQQLAMIETDLTLQKELETRFKQMISTEDDETIQVGRKQLDIEDLQDELAFTKETYDKITRRIHELEMDRKRPARISVAYNAEVALINDKRIKLSAAMIFGAIAAGFFLTFMVDKADGSIRGPEDVAKRIGVKIIGTTIHAKMLDEKVVTQQVDCDYQTIRANLGLLNGGGIPKKLVITSAAVRDGKTTFAINLATSLAKEKKKVLLVDGDLRKPDIRNLMNIPVGGRGLHDLAQGKRLEDIVYSVSEYLDVLVSESKDAPYAFETLSALSLSEYIEQAGSKYDHVVIDTPPVMAFPDAFLLAKMADGVIVVSFAGRTDQKELKDTIERLKQIKVRILGTVVHNVAQTSSYNRYGYGYYEGGHGRRRHRTNARSAMLLLPVEERENNADNSV